MRALLGRRGTLGFFTTELTFFTTELTFFTTELTFFTTEHTENYLRATEDCYFLAVLRAPR